MGAVRALASRRRVGVRSSTFALRSPTLLYAENQRARRNKRFSTGMPAPQPERKEDHVATADDDFTLADLAAIERTTREVGETVLRQVSRRAPHVFQRRWWDDRVMSWAMKNESVKVQMFRFIDVLPMLNEREAVTQHLQEYFEEVEEHLPTAVRLGLEVARPDSLPGRAVAYAARRNALGHARRFIAGTTTAEVLTAVKRARKARQAFTLDLLGEAVISNVEADRFFYAYIHLIESLAPTINRWPEVPQVDRGVESELPRVNVSIKLSALDSQFDSMDAEGTTRRVSFRLRELLRVARKHGAFINVDMESYPSKDLTLAIFKSVLMEDEFRAVGDVGIVVQCYLRDSDRDLRDLRDWARQRGKPIWVRLVKGAYWDYETIHARYHGWPIPVYQRKWQSDANYERQTRFVIRNFRHLRPALGSHNVRSLAHGIATARHIGLPPLGVELQMLYGMADAEREAFTSLGNRLRVYMPFGELIPGMAYLVRRLLENTSNDSFLRTSFTELLSTEELLMNPLDHADDEPAAAARPSASSSPRSAGLAHAASQTLPEWIRGFQNEPAYDFSRADIRQSMRDALESVREQFSEYYPVVIAGKKQETEERIRSINPSHKTQVVGAVGSATAELANQAVAAAAKAWPDWADADVRTRADYLLRAAEYIRERRFEFAACQLYECGKGWREADGDVCEAIDFLEYYARGAVALQGRFQDEDVPGEENRFEYLPRGVAAVIAPWNFPLAILTGMTSAALVTGNTVVMKPAEQSSVTGAWLMRAFEAAGLPPGVLNFLPGQGEVVGPVLVNHPQVVLIAFTGSRKVGLEINASAAKASAGGPGCDVKKVIAEMGGKNAILIDDDADLDEAVAGVVTSAFGYQGQKCSACSRVIVLSRAYDAFLSRLIEATKSLPLGPAEDPGARVGPVIDQQAFDGIRRYIEIGKQEGTLALGVDAGALAQQGYFIGPHVFTEIAPTARLAQEEIFGPVLAVLRADSLDEALKIANGTEYALTGGMYSRSPRNLKRAQREFRVGNLYLNRPITGALVARQPFGGFRMSGIGSKAGGPDYLLQFVLPRTITENTMRRGFAPLEVDE